MSRFPSRMISHHRADSLMARKLLYSVPSLFYICGWRYCRRFSNVCTGRGVFIWVWERILEGFIERFFVGVELRFCGDHPLEEIKGYHPGCLEIEGKSGLLVLMSARQNWDIMGRHLVSGVLLAKQNRKLVPRRLISLTMRVKTNVQQVSVAFRPSLPWVGLRWRGRCILARRFDWHGWVQNSLGSATPSASKIFPLGFRVVVVLRCIDIVQPML